jgi:all-trans-retinol 13,14-reductase
MIIFYLFCLALCCKIFYEMYKILSIFNKRFRNKKYNSHNRIRWYDTVSNELPINPKAHKVRYSNKTKPTINEKYEVIIIGSGIGSLTTACLLAKSGKRVLVLEQHDVAGGTTHVFDHKGIEHETGLHYIGDFKRSNLIFNLLTDDKLKWDKLGREREDDIYDEIIIADKHYKFPSDKKVFEEYLIKEFPNDASGIHKYFECVKRVSRKKLFFNLKVIHFNVTFCVL